ncbi:Smr/MutS family protein [Mesonia sp.]|uniref:Smr/MutS family protein n=1 Tax=Mesonia sp. TaxID=1960830 RepID=UPI001753567C|nr:Smr/MutS family protein [Mesonia sp.]HIB37402.1 DNA mismatch repair protein MutS [Mesonia sp.]HIO27098.1 DNA mismatch repair protein MutS [Flavobacteriaceae bacterium]
MKNNFQIGDWVEVLDDNISGEIKKIYSQEYITIETEDGFELQFKSEELVKYFDEAITIEDSDLNNAILQENLSKKNKSKSTKRQKTIPPLEVDLHIHHLTNSTKNLTNFEMLNIQLDTARSQLEFAIRKRIQKVVFIHGVGEGVLKAELETMLSRYNDIKFYEASFRDYGAGATEVYIFQNS